VIGDIIIANAVVSACLVLMIYMLDFSEKEPSRVLVRVFVASILATFLFGVGKTLLYRAYDFQFSQLFTNYVVAGFFEELLKFIVVMIFVWRLKSFNEEVDGIIYYLVVAAGFAVLENVGYSFQFTINPYLYGLRSKDMSVYQNALTQIVLIRAVSGHIFINIASGFFLGLARRKKRWWLLIPGFIVSVFLHGSWNQAAVTGVLQYYLVGFLLLDVLLFVYLARKSFYFKFMKRLNGRLDDLIAEAARIRLDEDLLILMKEIRQKMKILRQQPGETLRGEAKVITKLLPPRLEGLPREGADGLINRLITINGILARGREIHGRTFWVKLFLKFSISGFVIIVLLMNFVWRPF
jgi:RsiW-degrading membrane proteinase PrsW (M82 family)